MITAIELDQRIPARGGPVFVERDATGITYRVHLILEVIGIRSRHFMYDFGRRLGYGPSRYWMRLSFNTKAYRDLAPGSKALEFRRGVEDILT